MEELNKKRRLLKVLMTVLDGDEDSSSDEETFLSIVKRNSDMDVLLPQLALAPTKRVRILNYIEQVISAYTEEDFKTHFRLNRRTFTFFCQRFEEHEIYSQLRSDKKFPAPTYLLLFLWFAGHEACSFRDISDRFDTSLSSVHRIINRVAIFISSMSPEIIRWPNSQDMEISSAYFEIKSGIPRTIGAIDGTHIRIDPPKEGRNDYINRKNFTSICLQGICNEKRKFIDIFVGYPGSVHDSRVFQNSFIYRQLENRCKDYHILGDSAYPLMKNVLTPYRDNGHLTLAQKHFNRKLSSSRVLIEHTFGLLKQRFRQLYYCKLKGPKKLCHFVRACCVLHNLADETDFDFEDNHNDEEEETANEDERETNSAAAKAMRDLICNQLWEHHK